MLLPIEYGARGDRHAGAVPVDFRGLTPGRFWEATDPDGVVDTHRIGYRFAVTNDGGPHWVEQQMYYREQDGRLVYARVV